MLMRFGRIFPVFIVFVVSICPSIAMHTMDASVTDAGKFSLISVRGQLGVLNGEAMEVVYAGKSSPGNEDYKISELTWDLKSVVMAGVTVSLNGGALTLNAGLWMGVSEGTGGEMHNYDWMDPSIPVWTDKSRSEVDVIDAKMLDLNLSFRFFEDENVSLSVVGGLKYSQWEWDDRGQEFIYSINSFRDVTGSFEGVNVIDYKQFFVVPFTGIECSMSLGRLSLHGYFLYSSLVYAKDDDIHILRGINFKGTFSGGTYKAFGVSANLDISEQLFLQMALGYQKVDEIIGDMKVVEYNEAFSDAAGISHESTMISASLGIRL